MEFGIFLFCLDLELLIKILKNECAETRSFLFLQITQDLKKILKHSKHPFVETGYKKSVQSFSKKY